MSSTSNKRHKYTAQFKLRVVQFAEKSSNSKAGHEFGVNEKLVRDWRRNVDKLQSMPRKKWWCDPSKKCGISNAMDGTEDDMLWEDGEIARVDDNDEAAVEETDIYDDRLTAEQHL